MKATLLLLGDPRMSGCFACKCPFVNNWQRYSLTLRRCEAVLASVVDPQRPLVVELEQLKGNLAHHRVPPWSCQPRVSRMKKMMMMVPTKRDQAHYPDFLPVHRDQGDRVLLVDWLDRGDAFHRVCSHDPLIAGKERVNLCSVVLLAPEVGQLIRDWDASLQKWVLSSCSCAKFSKFVHFWVL